MRGDGSVPFKAWPTISWLVAAITSREGAEAVLSPLPYNLSPELQRATQLTYNSFSRVSSVVLSNPRQFLPATFDSMIATINPGQKHHFIETEYSYLKYVHKIWNMLGSWCPDICGSSNFLSKQWFVLWRWSTGLLNQCVCHM